jgi:predicted helicase
LALMIQDVMELQTDGGAQCFPRHLYSDDGTRRDAITDAGLAHFQGYYSAQGEPGDGITKEDLFYYVYGLLHSPDYRRRYQANLRKELPRIPRTLRFADFRAFSDAGRALAELHLNYETLDLYPAAVTSSATEPAHYRVEKMRFAKKTDGGKKVDDLTSILYNPRITVFGIPLDAYDYVVNGKSAIHWVMERQCVKTDKASGIVNDANDWAIETMHNPKYPLELLLRIITLSLRTNAIVAALPLLCIEGDA